MLASTQPQIQTALRAPAMEIPGERFHVDLDSEPENVSPGGASAAGLPKGINIGLVGDIKERMSPSDSQIPPPPKLKSSESGFPAHRIRTGPSRFKKRNQSQAEDSRPPDKVNGLSTKPTIHVKQAETDGKPSASMENVPETTLTSKDPSIDKENKQRLAEMSDHEIEEARQELMSGLSQSLLEKLLKKANIDEGRADSEAELEPTQINLPSQSKPSTKNVTFENPETLDPSIPNSEKQKPLWDPEAAPLHLPSDLHPASAYPSSLPQPPGIHFPNPPQAPDLDPSDPDFLSTLHSTYFPKLPADPSAMAWMVPLDPKAEAESMYSATRTSYPVSALRFDFRGRLLPPRLSAQIPSTKGLHHHAHAPSSAGYTVPELAHLARSSYPAQRCIAYQTLGRILYRLGRGDFGQEGEDLCDGLWQLMEQGKVVDQLVEAAAKGDSGNRSIWAIATEAVWLWRKGGGRKWRGR